MAGQIIPQVVLEEESPGFVSNKNQSLSPKHEITSIEEAMDILSRSSPPDMSTDSQKSQSTLTDNETQEQSANIVCRRHSKKRQDRSKILDNSTDGATDSQISVSTYCSPGLNRRQRSGSYPVRDRAPRYPTRELSSLRADGYLKPKHTARVRMNSGESRDSEDLLEDASHVSTCATSDYACFTSSMDTLNLCHTCSVCMQGDQQSQSTDFSKRPLSLDVDSTCSLRRARSNPENCKLDKDNTDSANCDKGDGEDGTYPDDNDDGRSTLTKDPKPRKKVEEETENCDTKFSSKSKSEKLFENKTRRKGSKSIAVSEENLVSRVSRWLSNMEEADAPDTF